MSISLDKRVEKVGIVLAKRNIRKAPVVRVGMALDISGSTQRMYNSGTMQETVDRLLAMAMTFDDNGELDAWTFTESFSKLPTITQNNIDNYVNKSILNNSSVRKWGGTSYSPVMAEMVEEYFPANQTSWMKAVFSKPQQINTAPAMVLFVTDGDTDDKSKAAKVLREAQKNNVYWQMVGVGPASHFKFLQEMADELPNVGFVNMQSLDMTDEDLYDQLISDEFCQWVSAAP